MSSFIIINTQRNGSYVPGLQGITLQIENASMQESASMGGTSPFMNYNAYAQGPYNFQEGDLLVDTQNTEPRSNPSGGRYRTYRILNDPEKFGLDHTELFIERLIGVLP